MKLPANLGGIRNKLIAIFVLIKVLPLILLAWFAWHAATRMGQEVSDRAAGMADAMLESIQHVGKTVTDDSIRALDLRSREAIETLTTDTARQIAAFLYDRDRDILQAAALEPNAEAFKRFLQEHKRRLYQHGRWQLAADGKSWQAVQATNREAKVTRTILPDNARDFHARPPEYLGEEEIRPLFVEMSFVDLDGNERYKATLGSLTDPALRNITDRKNTFAKAETYFQQLKALKQGEIFVSEVIGTYVPTHILGPYLPERLNKAGKAFAPEQSAYAGTENPVGKRFRGIVRWATPVSKNNKIIGYVTLALDHDHIRQFTDRLMPTEERYTDIADAIKGNYAFLWDHKSRAISHPRDYMIVGYDAQTGLPATPWMDEALYAEWQASGKPSHEFLADIPAFRDQNLKRKPAPALTAAGTLGLDCRYLNFSPQCQGWNALTEHGGSGSFVIFFSGLWKLTTAAAIPYYPGQYAQSAQGFGFVTIGANVDDFHKSASETANRINTLISEKDRSFKAQRSQLVDDIEKSLTNTAIGLWSSTAIMIVLVIGIAIWMANLLTTQITRMISGIHAFQAGDRQRRLEISSQDEMGELAASFNRMADSVQDAFQRLEEARARAEAASRQKSAFLATMSHELRTPLNGIIGFSELLKGEITDPELLEYAKIIHRSGSQLLALINDILDLARIEAGDVQCDIQPVDLLELLASCEQPYQQEARTKGLAFHMDIAPDAPESLPTDAARFRQVLKHLLSNAVKFTNTGEVRLSVSCHEERVYFRVIDTGRGIPPESLETIFEKFQQLDDFLTREHGGTGIGLAMAKRLVNLLDGEISVESSLGVGTTFTVSLPLNNENSPNEEDLGE